MKDAVLKRLLLLEQAQATRPMPHSEFVRLEMETVIRFEELGIVSTESLEAARNHDYSDGSEPFDIITIQELRAMLKYDEAEAVPE